MKGYYMLNGHDVVPCDDKTTAMRAFESINGRRVARDEIGDIVVSTVFLVMDHAYNDGPPILFETMIFGGEHDQYQERYSTWDEAVAGHAHAMAMVQEGK